jgi:orotate phosphoribosyltransferase
MKEQEILGIFKETKAIITNSHLVYKSGKHGRAYVNKDAVYPYAMKISEICSEIVEILDNRTDIDVIAAPTIGGVILGHNTAYQLNMRKMDFFRPTQIKEILSVYAEEENGERIFKRGYDKLIQGKNVVIVDDVVTTGGTVKKMISAVQKLGGKVIAVIVLCNRGGLIEKDLGVPFFALTNISLEAWPEEECPLCKEGVPINTEVGKGREYMAKKQAK